MNDIIKALQENRWVAYGGFSEEMKVLANKIGKLEFEFLHSDIRLGFVRCNNSADFTYCYIYRLRPDYEEKPEIVECKIFKELTTLMYQMKLGGKYRLSDASSDPDFIGFKHGDMLWGRLYKRKSTGQYSLMVDITELDQYEVCDMSDAHVIFRSKK